MAGAGVSDPGRWSLSGTTALVTGGTKGIGRAVVVELAALSAAVYTCPQNGAELKKCLEEWEASGFRVKSSVCDVSIPAERKKLIVDVVATFDGKLNILINNVGTFIFKATTDYNADDFSLLMSTNFESAFHLSQLAHLHLKASGAGSIIFISSAAGVVAGDVGSIYSATKGSAQLIKFFSRQ